VLAARPVRNAAGTASADPTGEVAIAVPMKRPRWLVPPLSWLVPLRPSRTVRLDNLGAQVWELCDGGRTVEEIVDEFARRHRLTFHEARVAVTGYLSQLVRRGVLAMAIMDGWMNGWVDEWMNERGPGPLWQSSSHPPIHSSPPR